MQQSESSRTNQLALGNTPYHKKVTLQPHMMINEMHTTGNPWKKIEKDSNFEASFSHYNNNNNEGIEEDEVK